MGSYAPQTMQPRDLGRVASVTDPQVAPDGSRVAVTVTTVDLKANRYRSRVWLVGIDGSSRPTPFTRGGEARDSRARWSPDGATVAFVSHRVEAETQILTLPVDTGGEPVVVATWPEDVEALEWSPDGRRLAFIARAPDPDTYGPDIRDDRDRPPRRVTRFTNRLDNVGWTMDRPNRVFVVDADGETPPVEVSGPSPDGSDVAGVAWSPDSRHLAWCQGVAPDWDLDLRAPLVIAPAPGVDGAIRVVAESFELNRPAWSPDGSAVAVVCGDRFNPPRNNHVAVLALNGGEHDGDAQPRVLTRELDRNCAPFLAGARAPKWVGDELWFQAEDRGRLHLYRVPADGTAAPEVVVGGDVVITGFDTAAGTVAYTATTAESPGELYATNADGSPRRLTAFNSEFARAAGLVPPERFVVVAADGEEIDAWHLAPTGPPRGATLLNIHGGPFSQYTGAYNEDFAVQAGAGFDVVWCNPRGSSGRSEAWGRAIRGPKCAEEPGTGWGGVDADDVMAVLDAAVVRFGLDPERIGVLGGSYGGYMTSWLIGHSDRFAAACSERAVNNQLAMVWTSDIGTTFQRGYGGASHLEDPGEYLRMSPVTYASAITTPLLILHSESDLRCPISQAEELWVALRLLCREVEFIRFPGSGHELTRSGPPRQRVQRSELILDFFDRHLAPPKDATSLP